MADDANILPEWILNVSRASLGGAKKSPAQMPFTDVVSGAPVPAVCQALQPLRNGAKQGKQIKLAGPKAGVRQFHLCFTWRPLLFLMPR